MQLLTSIATIAALGITVWQLFRTRKAAEASRKAAGDLTQRFGEYDATSACSSAVAIMREIKNYQQSKLWHLLPDRYSRLRNLIIQIRGATPNLDSEHKTNLQSALTQIATLSEIIEDAQHSPLDGPAIARLNKVISRQSDRVSEVLVQLRSQLGVNHD